MGDSGDWITATLLRDGNVHVVANVGGETFQIAAVDAHAKHMEQGHFRRLQEAAPLGMVAFKHTDSDHFGISLAEVHENVARISPASVRV